MVVGLSLTRDFVEGDKVYDLFTWRNYRSEGDSEWLAADPLGLSTSEIRRRIALFYFTDLHWMEEVAEIELDRYVDNWMEHLYELYNSTTSHIVF
ncbi:hypothetical protein [Pyrobaculum sp.]|uniref:hypothetical protein n=1 Tax=Pyrobaculum sp. TaxID=2004705 RepID=UPI003D120965